MSLPIFSHLENALESLRTNRARTLLTITGVTIGIGSIVCVLSLANGAANLLTKQTIDIQDRVAIVRSTTPQPSAALTPFSGQDQSHLTNNLTERDIKSLESELDASVVPLAVLHTNIHSRDAKISSNKASLVGSNTHLADLAKLQMHSGEFLGNLGGDSVILGNQLAIDLFGTEQAIGHLITIREQGFTVAGVLKQVDQSTSYLQIDFNNSAIVSLRSIKQFTENVAQIQQIALLSKEDTKVSKLSEQAKELITVNHKGETDFEILTGKSIVQTTNQNLESITLLVASVAGVSLLVGGIGIMNIMLVNVAERRREVGIRKDIGATSTHVVNQFLIESLLIGLLGGVLGYILGVASAYGMSLYLPITPGLQWQVAALGIGIAIATGVLFGIYPAVKAANKDPIESLRY